MMYQKFRTEHMLIFTNCQIHRSSKETQRLAYWSTEEKRQRQEERRGRAAERVLGCTWNRWPNLCVCQITKPAYSRLPQKSIC